MFIDPVPNKAMVVAVLFAITINLFVDPVPNNNWQWSSFVSENNVSLKMSALHEAASTGDLELLEEQLAKGLNPSEPDSEWGGKTPLHIACSAGHKKCVYVLLKAGADVNAQTDSGWTPAHCACETGQVWYAFVCTCFESGQFCKDHNMQFEVTESLAKLFVT